ncbi:MAG: hypothetical protein U0003_05795 [Vampirovibrionales bacterium]
MVQSDRVLQLLAAAPAVPIIRASNPEEALWAARVVLSQAFSVVEITWTTPHANEVIAALRHEFPQASLGVGSVLSEAHYEAAQMAGADWFISPMLDVGLVQTIQANGSVVIPGVLTPTEVYQACLLGVPAMKVFPIGPVGGVAYLKSLLEPFSALSPQKNAQLRLLVCGGVVPNQVLAYKQAGALAVGLGKALISTDIMQRRDADALEAALLLLHSQATAV